MMKRRFYILMIILAALIIGETYLTSIAMKHPSLNEQRSEDSFWPIAPFKFFDREVKQQDSRPVVTVASEQGEVVSEQSVETPERQGVTAPEVQISAPEQTPAQDATPQVVKKSPIAPAAPRVDGVEAPQAVPIKEQGELDAPISVRDTVLASKQESTAASTNTANTANTTNVADAAGADEAAAKVVKSVVVRPAIPSTSEKPISNWTWKPAEAKRSENTGSESSSKDLVIPGSEGNKISGASVKVPPFFDHQPEFMSSPRGAGYRQYFWYMLDSYETHAKARDAQEKLQARGIFTYIYESEKGFSLSSTPFESRTAAEAHMRELRAKNIIP